MQRITSICLLSLILLASAYSSYAEYAFPPSRYIGMFESFNGIKNGKLPDSTVNYTGKWENKNLHGNYKDGIPCGVWEISYPFGSPNITYYYSKSEYVSMAYFPDGLPQSQSSGTIEINENSFSHKLKSTSSWDPLGNKVNKSRFSSVNGWNWSHDDQTLYMREREGVYEGITISLVSFIVNSNEVMIAVYFYNDQYFIAKKVFVSALDHEKGELSLKHLESIGQEEILKFVIKIYPKDISAVEKELNIGLYIDDKLIIPNIQFKIIKN